MKSTIFVVTLFLVGTVSYAQNCSVGEVQCPGTSQCIPEEFLCDDWIDCGNDEWDENPENCPCNGFQCPGSSSCISDSWLCDGDRDCPGGEDEQNCTCFTCDNDPSCLPSSWICDYYDDCNDGTDELNCPTTARPPCSGFECPSGQCISDGWICDGDNDCGDWSDEATCPCDDGEFNCGRCIPEAWICDTVPDCPNGIDETNCTLTARTSISPAKHNFLVKKHLTVLEEKQEAKLSQRQTAHSRHLASRPLSPQQKEHKRLVKKESIKAARKLRLRA